MRYRYSAFSCGGVFDDLHRRYKRNTFLVYGAVPVRLGAPCMAFINDFVKSAQKTPLRIYILDGCMLKKAS